MKLFRRIFLEHPNDTDNPQGYWAHAKFSILNSIKGKGIKEFENDPVWHARQLQGKELIIGKRTLGIKI